MLTVIDFKHACGVAAVCLSTFNLTQYIGKILKAQVKPHAFSWIIWSLTMCTVFVAQHVEHAGSGSWQTLSAGIMCGVIGILSIFRGERNIVRSDWIAFIVAVGAIPLWILTRDPLTAVIILTAADCIGFYPTWRKSYIKPYEETISWAIMGTIVFGLSLAAAESYSWATALYPVALIFANVASGILIVARRRTVSA